MDLFRQEELLPIIQLAITPVILITGLGSLLLTMTNRMARIVDRTRSLAGQVRSAGPDDRIHAEQQLRIMFRRSRFIRLAVTLNTMSIFCAGLLVVLIFVGAIWRLEVAPGIVSLFFASVSLLIAALIAFLRDNFMSLSALRLEVDRALASVPRQP
jgi:hypothetical protein